MLQNHCKGTDFSPNNQKKTQKKSQTCHIFLIRTAFFKFAYLIFLPMLPLFLPSPLELSKNLSPNFHCFHHEWGLSLRTSNGSRLFQMILQIHIIYNIRMISVMYSSKDWSFNQILAYLWSFLSISAFVSINFCNFAVKQQKSIMAKLNRIRVVLAERDLNNKWLSDKLGKGSCYSVQVGHQYHPAKP